ncbi:MAG: hypothetical protein VX185_00275 [Pseudomonadota bacterium]|nr:hypothetical protein [Pseudomonadota bacterium]
MLYNVKSALQQATLSFCQTAGFSPKVQVQISPIINANASALNAKIQQPKGDLKSIAADNISLQNLSPEGEEMIKRVTTA